MFTNSDFGIVILWTIFIYRRPKIIETSSDKNRAQNFQINLHRSIFILLVFRLSEISLWYRYFIICTLVLNIWHNQLLKVRSEISRNHRQVKSGAVVQSQVNKSKINYTSSGKIGVSRSLIILHRRFSPWCKYLDVVKHELHDVQSQDSISAINFGQKITEVKIADDGNRGKDTNSIIMMKLVYRSESTIFILVISQIILSIMVALICVAYCNGIGNIEPVLSTTTTLTATTFTHQHTIPVPGKTETWQNIPVPGKTETWQNIPVLTKMEMVAGKEEEEVDRYLLLIAVIILIIIGYGILLLIFTTLFMLYIFSKSIGSNNTTELLIIIGIIVYLVSIQIITLIWRFMKYMWYRCTDKYVRFMKYMWYTCTDKDVQNAASILFRGVDSDRSYLLHYIERGSEIKILGTYVPQLKFVILSLEVGKSVDIAQVVNNMMRNGIYSRFILLIITSIFIRDLYYGLEIDCIEGTSIIVTELLIEIDIILYFMVMLVTLMIRKTELKYRNNVFRPTKYTKVILATIEELRKVFGKIREKFADEAGEEFMELNDNKSDNSERENNNYKIIQLISTMSYALMIIILVVCHINSLLLYSNVEGRYGNQCIIGIKLIGRRFDEFYVPATPTITPATFTTTPVTVSGKHVSIEMRVVQTEKDRMAVEEEEDNINSKDELIKRLIMMNQLQLKSGRNLKIKFGIKFMLTIMLTVILISVLCTIRRFSISPYKTINLVQLSYKSFNDQICYQKMAYRIRPRLADELKEVNDVMVQDLDEGKEGKELITTSPEQHQRQLIIGRNLEINYGIKMLIILCISLIILVVLGRRTVERNETDIELIGIAITFIIIILLMIELTGIKLLVKLVQIVSVYSDLSLNNIITQPEILKIDSNYHGNQLKRIKTINAPTIQKSIEENINDDILTYEANMPNTEVRDEENITYKMVDRNGCTPQRYDYPCTQQQLMDSNDERIRVWIFVRFVGTLQQHYSRVNIILIMLLGFILLNSMIVEYGMDYYKTYSLTQQDFAIDSIEFDIIMFTLVWLIVINELYVSNNIGVFKLINSVVLWVRIDEIELSSLARSVNIEDLDINSYLFIDDDFIVDGANVSLVVFRCRIDEENELEKVIEIDRKEQAERTSKFGIILGDSMNYKYLSSLRFDGQVLIIDRVTNKDDTVFCGELTSKLYYELLIIFMLLINDKAYLVDYGIHVSVTSKSSIGLHYKLDVELYYINCCIITLCSILFRKMYGCIDIYRVIIAIISIATLVTSITSTPQQRHGIRSCVRNLLGIEENYMNLYDRRPEDEINQEVNINTNDLQVINSFYLVLGIDL